MSVRKRPFAAIVAMLAAVFGLLFIGAATASATSNGYGGNGDNPGVSTQNPHPNAPITVTGQGCVPGATVTVSSHGTTLATGQAGGNGSYNMVVKMPSGSSGAQSLNVTGQGCGGTAGVVVQSSSGGQLASTGVAVISIVVVGAVLLAGGAIVLLLGRRRKATG